MASKRALAGLLIFFSFLQACKEEIIVTKAFEIGGPCETCPPERADSIVRAMEGVKDVKYDLMNGTILVTYDCVMVTLEKIQINLNYNGYDAGDFPHDEFSVKFSCCTPVVEFENDELDSTMVDDSVDDLVELDDEDIEDDMDYLPDPDIEEIPDEPLEDPDDEEL